MSGSVDAKALPEAGREEEEILEEMRALREEDVNWHDGKVWSLVFHASDELAAFSKQAYGMFYAENGLNPTAFPSLRRFEVEVISMVAKLLGGDLQVVGNMTSGGTESILMAVKAAREWGRKRGKSDPEMVLPMSAHPAFEKAAHYFGVKAVHVPVRKDFRVDLRAMRKAINRRTVLLVGSAPQYPQGVVDPIEEIAQLAQRRKLLCHVDACVGGMMLPFVRDLGHQVPAFDFAVPGVTSMSVDLHKYGYAAKGASIVLYRDAELRKHQYFAYTEWPGGIYVSPTMTGTRPGGAIAAAWAMLNRLGLSGYREIARDVMAAAGRIRAGVAEIEGVDVLGEPTMSVMALGSKTLDIYEVGDALAERGWHLDRQQNPASLHLTINAAHLESTEQLLADLREAAELCQRPPTERLIQRSKLLLVNTAMRVLPGPVATKVTRVASRVLGIGDGELPKKTAAMYGLMAALPNKGDLNEMVIELLDKLTRHEGSTPA
ncbi:MAG: aspartate aminotransferase family protein [Proteobacteria bacterium]|nr:MAG: aspartate aminotransferase family protein [Pseudomonadota bacterium]